MRSVEPWRCGCPAQAPIQGANSAHTHTHTTSPPHTQACSWRFLAFSGSFNVHLSVDEDSTARSLVFRLVKSSFMRDFEGRWQVSPTPGGAGRARIEHVLAVKPLMPIPAAISQYTRGIFTRQVSNILRDLEREIAAKAAADN